MFSLSENDHKDFHRISVNKQRIRRVNAKIVFSLSTFFVTDHQLITSSNMKDISFNNRNIMRWYVFYCITITKTYTEYIFTYLTMMTQLISQDFLSITVDNTVRYLFINHTDFPSIKKYNKNKRSVSDDMFPYQKMITHVTSQDFLFRAVDRDLSWITLDFPSIKKYNKELEE